MRVAPGVAHDARAAASAARARRWLPESLSGVAWGIAGTLLIAALLEALTRGGAISPSAVPPVTDTVTSLVEELGTSTLWSSVGSTLQGWVVGLAVAIALAVPAGVLIGSSEWLFRATRAPVEFLRPIPSVALIPLAILLYGCGLEMKVFLIAFACFWPLLIQTLYGMRDIDPVAVDTARAFRLGRVRRLVSITLPSASPYVATGVRIASAVALILAVTGELVVGAPGLGREIIQSQSGGAVERMYAYILATGLLGVLLNAIILLAERRILRWHPSHRTTDGAGR